MTRDRSYPWRFSLFMAAYYAANAVYQSFISVYFSNKGLDSAQIGLLMSAVPVVSVVTQPAWGAIGDRAKSRNNVLRAMCLFAAGMILLLSQRDGLWYYFGILTLFAASYTAIQPMGDSVILEALQHHHQSFGPIRLIGTYSFAVASIVFGKLIDGHLDRVPWMTAMLIGLVFLSTYQLPPTAGHARKKNSASMATLFKDRKLMLLIAMVTLLQITMGYFYVFFPVYFTGLPGGNSALLGWAFFVSSASETPFLLLIDRLFEKLGAGKLLLISAVSLLVRWLILALTSDVWVAMASQLLHGWGFIVMTVTMAKYISMTVPEELRTRGQMLLAVSGFGVARVVGNLGGGFIAQRIGLQATFGVMGAVALLTLVAFCPIYLRKGANA
jgi:PPP family 3-phenylpropionic acid transporter